MISEAAKLRADIATAEQRITQFYAQSAALAPQHRSPVHYQIKRLDGSLRDMRIKLASLSDLSDNRCPHCAGLKTHSFLVCMPCWRDVPFKLWAAFKGAEGLHHHGKVGDGYLAEARGGEISHLKQHSTAIV